MAAILSAKFELAVFIDGVPYLVEPLRVGSKVLAWRLHKDGGTAYQIDAEGACTCPAAVHQPERPCKHARALAKVRALFGGRA